MEPGSRVGRYTVEAWLGQGGMAVVYRVRDEAGEVWALKVLTLLRDEVRARFRAEARVQLALDHPNVVRARELVDVGADPGLVLEYVDGLPLDRFLAVRRPTLEVRDALAQQLLAGVAHAHAQRLVHRDLKPANVLVHEAADGTLTAKVADFGLVKEPDVAATRSGIALGTPRYMAPEQIRDAKRVDPRADVWSLGALLYELYTDHCPFERGTLLDTFTAVIDGQYEDPARFGVPERVREAIAACLVVDPAGRVGRVTDLARLLRGERVVDRPGSRWPSVAPPALPAATLLPPPTPAGRRVATPGGAPPRPVGPAPGPAAAPTLALTPPPSAPSDPQVFRLPLTGPAGRTPGPAPARARRGLLVPWIAGWSLALLLVGGVLGGTSLAVAAWVIGDAVTSPAPGPAPAPSRPPPRPARRRR